MNRYRLWNTGLFVGRGFTGLGRRRFWAADVVVLCVEGLGDRLLE